MAFAKLIAVNQLPLSFISSRGFVEFIVPLFPEYSPMKERLKLLKTEVKQTIKSELTKSSSVSLTSDIWTTRAIQPENVYIGNH